MTQSVQTRVDTPLVVVERRPTLVTFSAVMLFILAGFYLIASITEWSNSAWLYQRDFSVGGSKLVFWGFVDIVLTLVTAYGGYLLLAGRRGGQVLGFTFAGISFLRWLFYIPADPWLAIVILTLDALVIYALSAHDQWFNRG
jgi:hypothetical protein